MYKKTTGFISHIHVIRDKYVINTVRLEQNIAIHHNETKRGKTVIALFK
jgi:hypothetical protein